MWSLEGVLKTRRVKEWVFFELLVPGMTLPLRIPERLVPDKLENRSVRCKGEIGFDWKRGIILRVTAIELLESGGNES